jgi:hypothetical protein
MIRPALLALILAMAFVCWSVGRYHGERIAAAQWTYETVTFDMKSDKIVGSK